VGAQEAGNYLRELLERPGWYRRRWEQHVERRRPKINRTAVAQVLANQLQVTPERPGDSDATSRQVRHRVERALSGELLTPATLRLFIEAFSMSEADERTLWARFGAQTDGRREIVGQFAVTPAEAAVMGPQQHRTVLLHEFHRLGADGLPAEHRTVQTIEALVDGLDRYAYRFDTATTSVEVLQGGRAGSLYAINTELSAVDIELTQPLQRGEIASLEYRALFHYRDPPPPEFRRAARFRVENLLIRVQFDAGKLPASVWWAVWDGREGPIVEQEPVSIDKELAVKRYLQAIEQTVVGFHWRLS